MTQTALMPPAPVRVPAPLAPPEALPPKAIQAEPAAVSIPASSAGPAVIILFGPDTNGRPHGARFVGADGAAVERAADLMDLYCFTADTEALRELAAKLPAGRLFSGSGKAFVPFTSTVLYDRLCAATGTPAAPLPVRAAAKPTDAAPPAGAGSGGNGGADAPGGAPMAPSGWAGIKVGSTVLACQGPMEGWWEAVVLYTKADDRFVLRWRDFPDEPEISRARKNLGLLPPGSREGLG